MEIQVGEYVRTKKGNIFKIVGGNSDSYDIDIPCFKLENTEEDWFESNRYNENGYFFDEEHIVKHSSNIIDLIEEGDYVNGEKVLHIDKCLYEGEKVIITELNHSIFDNMIDYIVTKEQFNQMKYIVGDESNG